MKATGNGTATITAKATDGSGKSASCRVNGTVLIDKMWFEISPYVINAGWSVNQGFWYTPDNAKSTAVTWSSGNKQVATVSSDGTVQSNYNWFGTATITAKAKDGGGAWASYVVDVRFIRMDWARIYNPPGRSLTVGEGYGLGVEYGFTGDEASYPHFSWSSSDTSIATVNGGWVTAKKAGTVTITAYAQDGSGCTASCTINVTGSSSSGGGNSGGGNNNGGNNNSGNSNKVSYISMDTSKTMIVGDKTTMFAIVYPSSATNSKIIWSSDNNDIATVNSNGQVTAKKEGAVKITAKAGVMSAFCTVTVREMTTAEKDLKYLLNQEYKMIVALQYMLYLHHDDDYVGSNIKHEICRIRRESFGSEYYNNWEKNYTRDKKTAKLKVQKYTDFTKDIIKQMHRNDTILYAITALEPGGALLSILGTTVKSIEQEGTLPLEAYLKTGAFEVIGRFKSTLGTAFSLADAVLSVITENRETYVKDGVCIQEGDTYIHLMIEHSLGEKSVTGMFYFRENAIIYVEKHNGGMPGDARFRNHEERIMQEWRDEGYVAKYE